MESKELTIQGINFNISTEIFDLLFFADGVYKNCECVNKVPDLIGFNINIEKKQFLFFNPSFSFKCSESSSVPFEPSAIFTDESILKRRDFKDFEAPDYFPTYLELTPIQRYAYLKYLENPFAADANMSYVYLFYYGLERNLFTDKYEKAIEIIQKLMIIFNSKGFLSHSITSLLYIALIRNDKQRIMEYLNSNYYEYIHPSLLYYCFFTYKIPIPIKYIIKKTSLYNFYNKLYIKKCPNYFTQTFSDLLYSKYGKKEVFINDFVSKKEFSKYNCNENSFFANDYLPKFKDKIPYNHEYKNFNSFIQSLLEKTHLEVKKNMAKSTNRDKILQNENTSINTKTSSSNNKPKKEEYFDYEMESILLSQYEKSYNYDGKHAALKDIISFYYKYRNKDKKYNDLCIKYCKVCIDEMEKNVIEMKPLYLQRVEEKLSKKLSFETLSMISKTIYNVDDYAYSILFSIALKNNNFDEALSIMEKARDWSTSTNSYGVINNNPEHFSIELNKAKEKYLRKIKK